MKGPLCLFFLVGGILFLFATGADPIIVDSQLKQRLALQWTNQMGSPPSELQLASLVERWIEEELLYREALQLGLHEDDSIVRRRLVQKARFYGRLTERNALSDDDIRKHYEENIDSYTEGEKFSFSQILTASESEYGSALDALNSGVAWRELGELSLLPASISNQSPRAIRATFGELFTAELMEIDPEVIGKEQWVGPIFSEFGVHLINLQRRHKPLALPFEVVEERVATDLGLLQEIDALEKFHRRLRAEYYVEYR